MKARTFSEPFPDQRRFVRAVVVGNDMDVQWRGDLGLDAVQKLTEFCGTMAPMRWPITWLVFRSSAANNDVVPWRL